jgi:glycosyltransferase involved in cell wall biosynthesis
VKNGVKYHFIGDGGTSSFGSVNLQRLLRKLHPDVIVSHFVSGDAFFNAVAYGRCPIAAIAMGHDVLYERGVTRISKLRRLLIRMGLRRAVYIAAKSKYLADRIRSYGVTCALDVNVWGADLERFSSGDRDRARDNLGFPRHVPIVLSPRAIEPYYNCILIAEAFVGVLGRYPDAILVMLGRSKPAYRLKVEEAIAALGIASNVRFVSEVSQSALPEFYHASDLVVSMAPSEGFPNTILEVMNCEIPIVIGRIPQIEELLSDGVNARLCEIEKNSIETTMLDVLDKPEDCRQMVANARKLAQSVADIKKNGRIFSQHLKAALKQSHITPSPAIIIFRIVFFMYLMQTRIFGRRP